MTSVVFSRGLNAIDSRVFAKLAQDHARQFALQDEHQHALSYLIATAIKCGDTIARLQRRNLRFKKRVQLSNSELDLQELILDYSVELGADNRQLKGDMKALSRYLDSEALNDRVAKQVGQLERELIFLLGRFREGVNEIQVTESHERIQDMWRRSKISALLEALLLYKGDVRVRIAAVNCVNTVSEAAVLNQFILPFDAGVKRLIFRFAQDEYQNTELQIAALAALASMDIGEYSRVAEVRLQRMTEQTEVADDFFVSAEIARQVCRWSEDILQHEALIQLCAKSPSDFVRQELINALPTLPFPKSLATLLAVIDSETCDRVLASALFCLVELNYTAASDIGGVRSTLIRLLNSSKAELVQRAALDVIPRLACLIADLRDDDELKTWFEVFEPAISELHIMTENLKVRRWASCARDALWVNCHALIREQYLALCDYLDTVPLSKARSIQAHSLCLLSDEQLGRILSVVAQTDFGLDVRRKKKGIKVVRWYHFGFRWWRFWFELKHSASDKRQAHKHMVGRVFYGLMSVPSNRLAEQTKTKVPGEPVTVTKEDGPRNYLPLVDELISSLDQSWPTKPLKIYSSEGITEILPPNSFWVRLKARWLLNWKFDKYAQLRNWQEGSTRGANAYLTAVQQLGFSFRMVGYTDPSGQPYKMHTSVSRFLPNVVLPSLVLMWEDIRNYFLSVYANSLTQLWVFLCGLFGFFLGKHALANHRMNQARKAIPLSVGGWGTRGKSGTERLKAAVFNGLGLNIISKTTGCEAMFLEGNAHQKLREMFLFRPYDKATIWEQVNLMRLAADLNADVFLWECMGLTPAYVHILQHHWMRDDISTITNTYPDHEDVQGPAGFDIPVVMNEFIPPNSTLVTSEEIMFPILKHGADNVNTRCVPVTWRETMTVTRDILARFPYEEHQNNIALVARMCEELGISRSFALKAMADFVVLDLGVLKTYPRATVNGRTLEYVMGNSANERLGAIGNWRRMGFEAHSLQESPEVWVSTVVNNRADRIPRSKVFASMLVKDLSADQHVIIGTNVDGFEAFLQESWNEEYESYSIWQAGGDIEAAKEQCRRIATRVRIATDERQITARLAAMLAGLGIDTDDMDLKTIDLDSFAQASSKAFDVTAIVDFVGQWRRECAEFNRIIESLDKTAESESNTAMLALAEQAFFSRVIFKYDSMLSGEEIISAIARRSPPGLLNRIMGMQNIKGTGLDFVYRWQAWERCYRSCVQLRSDDEGQRVEALGELRSFEEYGQLSRDFVKQEMATLKTLPQFQIESLQAELSEIERKVNQSDQIDEIAYEGRQLGQKMTALINWAEQFLDLGDAVSRRKQADQIYKDLANYRISRARAVVELQALTKRQKGGWLLKQFSK